jgi:hypothetical protein
VSEVRRKHRRTTGERSDLKDSSPPEIQAVRKAFINQFMQTGHLDGTLHSQLLAYAVTQRPPEMRDDT